MSEINYLIFVLGYDLLQREFAQAELECDTAYSTAGELIKEFLLSDEYSDYTHSAYEALEIWKSNNYTKIINKIKNR